MCRTENNQMVFKKKKRTWDFHVDELQLSRCTCAPYVSERPPAAAPASLRSVGNNYWSVRHLTCLKLYIYCEIEWCISTCLAGSCIAWTNLNESTVVARIASVRPYLNIRNDALSYVEQHILYILGFKNSTQDISCNTLIMSSSSIIFNYEKGCLTWSRPVAEPFARRHLDSAYVALAHFFQNEKT